jgi:glutamate-ammonia-ligase adenylyltransferase
VNLPQLLVYTDNIRILEALVETKRLSQAEGEMLAEAYRFYRSKANHCVLQQRPALAPLQEVAETATQVQQIWQRWLG